ncbi:hypothetical protein CCMA1212_005254 [Trichoderma ghanense]|uniref:Uncharacterized protein n=1 Tax=Trichoderma ghanense TaxID=65468 RepID=A0ABY2H5V2_9HYPO
MLPAKAIYALIGIANTLQTRLDDPPLQPPSTLVHTPSSCLADRTGTQTGTQTGPCGKYRSPGGSLAGTPSGDAAAPAENVEKEARVVSPWDVGHSRLKSTAILGGVRDWEVLVWNGEGEMLGAELPSQRASGMASLWGLGSLPLHAPGNLSRAGSLLGVCRHKGLIISSHRCPASSERLRVVCGLGEPVGAPLLGRVWREWLGLSFWWWAYKTATALRSILLCAKLLRHQLSTCWVQTRHNYIQGICGMMTFTRGRKTLHFQGNSFA